MKKSRLDRMSPAQILALGFLGLIVVGSILLAMPWASTEEPLSYIDALFTATSAVCVTGLVVVETGARFTPAGQAVILVLIQLGGLGLMTMATAVAILFGKRITFRERLVMQEALNHFSLEGLVRLTRYIVGITITVEAIAALFLYIRFKETLSPMRAIWFSVFHSVSAFCNAGFDLFGDSLERFVADPLVNIVIMALIITGGIGFSVIADLYTRRGFKRLSLHSRIVLSLTVILIVIPALLIGLLEWNGVLAEQSFTGKVFGSLFASVTTRTAGFNTVPTGNWSSPVMLLMMVLMFIGASPASTGGGIKTTTAALVFLYVVSVIQNKVDITIGDRRLPHRVVAKGVAVAVIALSVVLGSAFLLSIFEQHSFLDIVFESVSAFGTVGLSRGITSSLSTISRIIVIVTMFTGRVGVLTFVLALSARRKPLPPSVRYPEGNIIVG